MKLTPIHVTSTRIEGLFYLLNQAVLFTFLQKLEIYNRTLKGKGTKFQYNSSSAEKNRPRDSNCAATRLRRVAAQLDVQSVKISTHSAKLYLEHFVFGLPSLLFLLRLVRIDSKSETMRIDFAIEITEECTAKMWDNSFLRYRANDFKLLTLGDSSA